LAFLGWKISTELWIKSVTNNINPVDSG